MTRLDLEHPPDRVPRAQRLGRDDRAHLAIPDGSGWGYWRWACLRGAGFPAHLVDGLASPCAAAAADALVEAEAAAERARQGLVPLYRAEADRLRREAPARAPDAERRAPPAESRAPTGERREPTAESRPPAADRRPPRKAIARALATIESGGVPDSIVESLEPARQQYAALVAQVEAARATMADAFDAGVRAVSARIREIAVDGRFRTAVLLQNRKALRQVLDGFGGRPAAARVKKDRQREELVASYLQRYCLKNDTAGFFGPVGWARLADDVDGVVAVPGPGIVSRGELYFENWGIEALAETIATNPAIAPWMPVRLLPFFCLQGSRLLTPGACTELPPLHAAVLARCDGTRTAAEVAREILAAPELGVAGAEEIYAILRQLAAKNVVAWSFEIPFALRPERKLRALLERIEPEPLRVPALRAVDELDAARARAAQAARDPDALEAALDELDDTFARLTGREATRAAGAMYAARTLVYQDCRRDADVRIGRDVLAELHAPLSLLLASSRWFTFHAAEAYRAAFDEAYDELARMRGDATVEFLAFWIRVEPLVLDPSRRLVQSTLQALQDRWARLLAIPAGERRVERSSRTLAPRVAEVFAAPAAGWQHARYHSPDVMIAASSAEAIRRGDYRFVLGELHAATNTLRGSFAVSQHPRQQDLFDAVDADFPLPRLLPVPPRHWPRVTNRTTAVLTSAKDVHVELSPQSRADAPRERVLPIAALVVERTPAGLVVRSRDRRIQVDVIEAFAEALSVGALEAMRLFPPAAYTPRVAIDRLVITRETWSFPSTDLSFVDAPDDRERFVRVRAWRGAAGLPRRVFIRIPVEQKPCFIDFDSPVYTEILVKMARRLRTADPAGTLVISEMLPEPGDLWLIDRAGHRFTSELRLVARDLEPAQRSASAVVDAASAMLHTPARSPQDADRTSATLAAACRTAIDAPATRYVPATRARGPLVRPPRRD